MSGAWANLDGHSVALGADDGAPEGRVQFGICPELVQFDDSAAGLPVLWDEHMGRRGIIRAEYKGRPIDAVLSEGLLVPDIGVRVSSAPEMLGVSDDDWRVAPKGRAAWWTSHSATFCR